MKKSKDCIDCQPCAESTTKVMPPASEAAPCANPEECSNFTPIECLITTEDITCGDDTVVQEGSRLSVALAAIVAYFCEKFSIIAGLTQDMVDAITNSNSPSETNYFITLNDLATAIYTELTYAEASTLIADSEVVPGTLYKITDLDIFLTGLTPDSFSIEGARVMRTVKNTYYTPSGGNLGVWYDGLTPAATNTVVWGGQVWTNNAGVVGSADSESALNSDWTLVPSTNDTYYEDTVFEIIFEFQNSWVASQKDSRGNILGISFVDKTDLGFMYNPCDISDWGNASIFENENWGVFNNRSTSVARNKNIGLIHSNVNGGTVTDNINTGSIIRNANLTDIRFNSNNGAISDNTNGAEIERNNNNGGITQNNNTSEINFNSNQGDITTSTNTVTAIVGNSCSGDISGNANQGGIRKNKNAGEVTNNTNTGDINYNFNGGRISGNTCAGSITENGNSGDILTNSNTGNIVENMATGDISLNTSNVINITRNNTGGPIQANSNAGHITLNSVSGTIALNASNGHIQKNNLAGGINSNTTGGDITDNNCGDISFNANTGSIMFNSNGGYISNNTSNVTDINNNKNNGNIGANDNTGAISDNMNNGDIATLGSTVTNVTTNINNGDITSTIVGAITDPVVTK